MRVRVRCWVPIAAACALTALTAPPGSAASAAPSTHRVQCSGAVQHPITARIEALDPVRRGAIVRLRVTATSQIALDRSRVRLLDAGGATVLSAREAALGLESRERQSVAEFRVQAPSDGRRALVQLRVEGEGPAGVIGRGVTFNLLPDGPEKPARVVAGSQGRQVAEYPARRIER